MAKRKESRGGTRQTCCCRPKTFLVLLIPFSYAVWIFFWVPQDEEGETPAQVALSVFESVEAQGPELEERTLQEESPSEQEAEESSDDKVLKDDSKDGEDAKEQSDVQDERRRRSKAVRKPAPVHRRRINPKTKLKYKLKKASSSSVHSSRAGHVESRASLPEDDLLSEPALPPPPPDDGRTPLVVAMAARKKQLDGVLVVINSALAHAKDPHRLLFCVITTAEDADGMVFQLKERLAKSRNKSVSGHEPNIVAIDFTPWTARVAQLIGGKSSLRKELFDELNFAAFYLHEVIPDAPNGRVLYLDTDVVVKTDLAVELSTRDLEGKAAGVAEDCSQKMQKYFTDMEAMKEESFKQDLPLKLKAKARSCVVNRGVVLVDVKRWAEMGITTAIEALVRAHLTEKIGGPLWRAGVSQPPFLLVIVGRYYDLGPEFNVRGLGRGDIALEEVDYYKQKKGWSSYYNKFLRNCTYDCCPGCYGWALSPHMAPLASNAKILHFNGKLKPSGAGQRSIAPMEPPPLVMDKREQAAREKRPLCSCGRTCVQECAALWWQYLPPE